MKKSKKRRMTPILNEGQRLLRATDWPGEEIAKQFGISLGYAHHLMSGLQRPGRSLTVAMDRKLKIPVDSWDQPPQDEEEVAA